MQSPDIRSSKDYSLKSGERQFASDLAGVRGDHRNRYLFGLDFLPEPGFGIDLFCGVGYGCHMASLRGHRMLGVDASAEAIDVANASYAGTGNSFRCDTWPFELPEAQFDFAFCLESVEHVSDGLAFVAAVVRALRPGGILVLSTPNQDLMPFNPIQHRFHTRHFTRDETFTLFAATGCSVLGWGGQTVYDIDAKGTHRIITADAPVIPGVEGQFLILAGSKTV
jgi:2-polyprenyl-3-methyl-5-hydroxy-6-metoxy-1,4-benzoquinol methylase